MPKPLNGCLSQALPALNRQRFYENSLANSIKDRTAIPDGPFAIHGLLSSIHAVPAMSRCSHGVSSANSFRNIAALTAPPQRPPELTISAMLELMFSLYSSSSGSRQNFSPAFSFALL